MEDDQGSRLLALRERIVRGEYEIDCRAVAEAIARRVLERAVSPAPSQGMLIAQDGAVSISEDEARRAV